MVQLQGDAGERGEGRKRVRDMRGVNRGGGKEGSNKCNDVDTDGYPDGIGGGGDGCEETRGGRTLRTPPGTDDTIDSVSTAQLPD